MRTHEYSRESALWANSVLEQAHHQMVELENELEFEQRMKQDDERKMKVCMIQDIIKSFNLLGWEISPDKFYELYDKPTSYLSQYMIELTDLMLRKYLSDRL